MTITTTLTLTITTVKVKIKFVRNYRTLTRVERRTRRGERGEEEEVGGSRAPPMVEGDYITPTWWRRWL